MADDVIHSLTLEVTSTTESADKAVDKLIGTLEKLNGITNKLTAGKLHTQLNKIAKAANGFGDNEVDGMKRMTQALEDLGKVTSNLSLGNIGTQLANVKKAATGFGETESTGLNRMLESLEKLQSIPKSNISNRLGNQLVDVATAARVIQDVDFSGVTRLTYALKELSGVGKANIASTLTQLNRIPEIAENLKKADISEFSAEIRELAEAMKPLATEMDKVSRGFSAFPEKIQRFITETDKSTEANKRHAYSYVLIAAKIQVVWNAMTRLIGGYLKLVKLSNEQIETANLFTVAMGQYAEEAKAYAETVAEAMGLNPVAWMEGQGVFMTLATGFGIAGDAAAEMSTNLTQLGYDIASFYNISTEEAFRKIQSGLAGEIEPMRRLGYDLSYAKLQQIAYANGINKTVTSMTQAEKAALRYYAIMEQVTQTHGDLARTIDSPSNMLRRLSAEWENAGRAMGNLFLPVLKTVVPWLIAGANAVERFANGMIKLFGIEVKEETEGTFENVIGNGEELGESLDSASESAKKLKNILMGFDELNVISQDTGIDLGLDEDVSNAFDPESIENIWAGLDFDSMSLNIPDTDEFCRKLLDFANGISTAFAILGQTQPAGILKIVSGIGEVIDGIRRIATGGADFDSVLTVISGISSVAAGIGILTGNLKLAGYGMALHGLTTAVREIADNWEAIKAGDWSGVDKVTLIVSAIEVIGGVAIAFEVFSKLKGVLSFGSNAKKVADTAKEAAETTAKTSTWAQKLSTNLKGLAQTLGWGVLIITEVAAAAAITVGAVALLGYELQLVAESWGPVIENGGLVAVSMGVGLGILAGIGAACYGLGSIGKTAAVNIGIGIAVLAEIGIATGLFIAEIWAIGWGLDEVGKAWQPVIDNGEEIAISVGVGTGLLVGVAAAVATLGAVSVASYGALPLAIGIGTAVLAEMGIAVGLFIVELTTVADLLTDKLHPTMNRTVKILPALNEGVEDFVVFMVEFAGHVVVYAEASAVTGFASSVDKIVRLFSGNPVQKLADDVDKIGKHAKQLNSRLKEVNPELDTACNMMKDFQSLVKNLNSLLSTDITLESKLIIRMNSVGKNIVSGLVIGIKSGKSDFDALMRSFEQSVSNISRSVSNLWSNIASVRTASLTLNMQTTGIRGYATGGTPARGELFWAREDGLPEMVGRIGSQTTVANNDQIVTAIREGVYDAVTAAMRTTNRQGQQSGEQIVNVYLDGKQITANVEQHQRERGVSIMGGVVYG